MVSDVAPGALEVVGRQQPLQRPLALGQDGAAFAAILPAVRPDHHFYEVEHGAVLDDQPPVHIGFAEAQTQVAGDVEADTAVGEPNSEVLAAARAERLGSIAGSEEGDAAFRKQLVHQLADQRHL